MPIWSAFKASVGNNNYWRTIACLIFDSGGSSICLILFQREPEESTIDGSVKGSANLDFEGTRDIIYNFLINSKGIFDN